MSKNLAFFPFVIYSILYFYQLTQPKKLNSHSLPSNNKSKSYKVQFYLRKSNILVPLLAPMTKSLSALFLMDCSI